MISVESPFELNSTFDDDGLWGLGNDPWFYTTNNNTSDSVHLLNVFNIGIQYFYLDSIDFAEDFMTYFVDELQYGQDSLVNHLIQIAEIFSDESPTGELMTQSLTAKTGTINIYPNPAWDQIQIQSDREISYIQVYDLQGRMFEERKFEVGVKNVRMPLYSWPPGQYFLRIQLINGEWEHQQIFKASK